MAITTTYLTSTANLIYSANAFAYVGSEPQRVDIQDFASILGISAGAIPGAMAEESHAYNERRGLDDIRD